MNNSLLARLAGLACICLALLGVIATAVELRPQRADAASAITRKAIAARIVRERATWYGPGLWGRRTACGVILGKLTMGVAHRRLPCGTTVALAYQGRWVRTSVIDRGPYRRGYRWDLTRMLAAQLGILERGTARVRVAVPA